jgi:hypothetical protein
MGVGFHAETLTTRFSRSPELSRFQPISADLDPSGADLNRLTGAEIEGDTRPLHERRARHAERDGYYGALPLIC